MRFSVDLGLKSDGEALLPCEVSQWIGNRHHRANNFAVMRTTASIENAMSISVYAVAALDSTWASRMGKFNSAAMAANKASAYHIHR